MCDTAPVDREGASYKGVGTAIAFYLCAALTVVVFLPPCVILVAEKPGVVSLLLLATLVALAAYASFFLAWPTCWTAHLDDGRVTFHQLGRTRVVNVEAVTKITTRSYGEGTGTLYLIHHDKGVSGVASKSGRAFANAIVVANPAVEARGWKPTQPT